MSDRIKTLRDRKVALLEEADALQVKEEDGSISEEELTRLDEITLKGGDLEKANAAIEREEGLMEERRSIVIPVPGSGAEDDPAVIEVVTEKAEFETLGEYLQAVAHAGSSGMVTEDWDTRLIKLFHPGRGYKSAATGANEGVLSEGGFLVQKDFSTALLAGFHETGLVMSRTFRVPLSSDANSITLPMIDETSRVDGSRFGGVQAYWANEADTVTASKPKFRDLELSLKKLFGLAYATEELLRDASALGTIFTTAFTEELTFKAEDAIVNGDGGGKPLGLINSGALVSVAKESAQVAATVVSANILKMWSRMPARMRGRAVWLINQDIEPQLHSMTIGTGAGAPMMYRLPGIDGPLVAGALATLMGAPVIPIEYCATLGTVGDIMLVDLGSYIVIEKEGVRADSSMHVRFINDEMTFRFIHRLDGQPTWRSPLTPFKGSNTQSPYVALATRE